jgi:RNA polymerase sigma factor (sigma-70 family)
MAEIDVTLVVKPKHAILWAAAKNAGGQSALGRKLGVSPVEIGQWINMQSTPNFRAPAPNSRFKRPGFLKDFEKKLWDATQHTIDEVWPLELCDAVEFLATDKTFEITKTWDTLSLEHTARETAGRLALPAPDTEVMSAELKERIAKMLTVLPEREQNVLSMRYGLGDAEGKTFTFTEIGNVMGITRERVRQLEERALRRLQQPDAAAVVVEYSAGS